MNQEAYSIGRQIGTLITGIVFQFMVWTVVGWVVFPIVAATRAILQSLTRPATV
jgi:hypothetical protein